MKCYELMKKGNKKDVKMLPWGDWEDRNYNGHKMEMKQ